MRWVHRYVPERARIRRALEPAGEARRLVVALDETHIQSRPKTGYLYRAVDKQGKTVESLFQTTRGISAAMAFFRKAVATCAPRFPRKITLDGHKQTHWGARTRQDPSTHQILLTSGLLIRPQPVSEAGLSE